MPGHSFPRQHITFGLLTVLMLAIYWLVRTWFPLAPYYRRIPLSDVRSFTPSLAEGMVYGLLLLVLHGLYMLAYRWLHQGIRPRPWLILGIAVLFGLPLLQTYPVNATDIFRYWLHGRVTAVHHANPYTAAPDHFPDDPYMPLAGEWRGESSPYGPVWEIVAAVVAAVTPNNLYAGLLAFKVIGLTTFVLCGWLIWHLLANVTPEQRTGYTLLWAWNPALLLTFVIDAHNDALMLLWLLLGLWVLRRGHPAAGLLVMLLAALTKPIALLPLPFFFLAAWWGTPVARMKIRLVLVTAVAGLGFTTLLFLPFGSPLPLVTRLVREAANYPGFSLVTLILLIIPEWGTLTMAHYNLVVNNGRLLFLLLAVWLVWRTRHGRSPLHATADIFLGYLLTAPAFRIWYAVWPFPWLLLTDIGAPRAPVDDGRLPYRVRVGLWFLLTTQLSVIIYGHLHVFTLNDINLPTHLIGVPFTFGLPFLLATFPLSRRKS